MSTSKAHIIARLQKEILPLQGYKPAADNHAFDAGLGPIKHAFPNASFPLGAVHEFFCNKQEDTASTTGFIAGVLSPLVKQTGVILWVSAARTLFPPALQWFGILPHRVIFVDAPNEKERLWVLEEALKCESLSAVVCETREISFTASRRFQLAVEQSKVTGFIIRQNPVNLSTACVTRWKISPLPGQSEEALPGLSFPRWNVELVKVRNGKPGNWQLEWAAGRFQQVYKRASLEAVPQRKAG